MNIRRLIRSLFVGIWRAAEGVRKILHLVFLLLVVGILIAGVATQDQPRVPEQAALMVAPEGRLVEQLSGGVLERALAEAQGVNVGETLLKDVVDAIRAAADDDRIEALVLDPTGLAGGGLSKLQELADEIVRFKESEKPVIAIGDYFTRDQYYLAAHADEIYMNPLGLIWMSGYSRFLTYYKSAIDNLHIDYHVWTVGEYKSFVEPVSRDDMSPEDRESSEVFLGALWDAYQADVTAARQLPGDALQRFADEAVELLVAADGDSARMALDYGLVDELLTRDQIRQRLDELVGDPEDDDYETVGTSEYLAAASGSEENSDADDTIAVIVASGSILDGSQPPGTIGGDSTAATIRRATEDDDVKALVLRVDSGGGSAFASEIIQRELQVFRESGRPVVASMSSVAASGGYWISMGADEIW
ncbi:MAG: signal peptide peptidase SppA, partial [Rhodospirillaceae bacterium]|nr:signal peptide peptidase SppA [Rhodospirillaceae bacterium]